ncbi:MFS transporter [Halorubrum sp. CBA1125]|uniref:MFS transporter n=1 Tax=Halorubrum sp. CBA1125 TaxID=2668072 RepID=UPI0012E7E569|nr:MFS transporter [Halorubrum sp. CBA1125]MUW14545.1 MFS transporter [Halorubrum sp. CBA1125]
MVRTTERELYGSILRDRQTVLILGVTLTGMLGSVLSPALPGIADALNVSDGRVGLLVSFFKVPSILVIPVAAWFADVYGRRTVLVPSLFVFGCSGAVMFLLDSFPALLAFAFVMGIGAAAIFPVTVTLLGDNHDGAANSAAQGLRVGIVGLGTMIVPAATGYLASVRWNVPFLLYLVAIPVAAFTYLVLDETIERAERSGSVTRLIERYGLAMRTELKDTNVRILILGGFTRGFVRYALLTFIPLFAVRILDASLVEAGSLLSLRGIGYVFVSPLAGLVVARTSRKLALGSSLLISAVTLTLIPFSDGLVVLGGSYSRIRSATPYSTQL